MSSSSQSPSRSRSCFLSLVLAAVIFSPPLLVHASSRPLLRPSGPDGCNSWLGRKVGGRMDLTGVESNEELQALGRFAVEEHNRRAVHSSKERFLAFRKVERAQSQVVAGIKYYLTVSVAGGAGRYDAEIVVRAWENSRELLSFTPAADGPQTHTGVVNDDGGCGGTPAQ